MRILLLGSGGREHALARALAASPQAPALVAAPGNPGTAALGTNADLDPTDAGALVAFAKAEGIDLTVVGPEQPLVAGVVDAFEAAGLPVVGPTAAAARLEGSKAFAKAFMAEHGIPTAAFRTFAAGEADAAHAYLDAEGAPVVVKASGLAGGKGAFVCATLDEAHDALDRIVGDRIVGDRIVGDRIRVRRATRWSSRPSWKARRRACLRSRTAHTTSSWLRRKITRRSARAAPGPTRAAWAPTPPRRS